MHILNLNLTLQMKRVRARSRKKNIVYFCVNRGDKLLCFYIKVTFENIGFRVFFRAFFVCMSAALGLK